jgi:methyl-accepting chemotaxis protein
VVADEVRELAERCTEATAHTSSLVADTQHDTDPLSQSITIGAAPT